MRHGEKLSLGEFLRDIRLVITSPARRFALIQERGAAWGSWVLLLVPAYLAFNYVGGLYFAHAPFPGYYFIPPLLAAIAATYLKVYSIHICAHLFQRKRATESGRGTFPDLLVVYGYTGVPAILAILLATAVFLLIPQEIGRLMLQVKAIGVSIVVAIVIALFIWNLILVVLALRTVYSIRDIQIVLAFIMGSALMTVPALGTFWIIATPHVDFAYVQSIYSTRILRFFASDPTSSNSQNTKIQIHVDKLAYRLRAPERFELVVFLGTQRKRPEKEGEGGLLVGSSVGIRSSIRWEHGTPIVGRIVGLPGDTVELVDGNLRVNGQRWDERYLAPEYRSNAFLPSKSLMPSEYLILPENRNLISEMKDELVVRREQIVGRQMVNKWPLGWWVFRPTVFLQAQPVMQNKTP
jgi:signal peptidase I